MAEEKMVEKVTRIMKTPEKIRNIGVCAHIDHGKTTFSDNLLAGAGMMAEELAGKQLALDFHEDTCTALDRRTLDVELRRELVRSLHEVEAIKQRLGFGDLSLLVGLVDGLERGVPVGDERFWLGSGDPCRK